MDYNLVTFTQDKTYVGLRYGKGTNMPAFWDHFTHKLYTSALVADLIEGHEAIGYRRYKEDRSSDFTHEYYAACQLRRPTKDLCGFERIVIPKGDYLLFPVRYSHKDADITEILTEHLPILTEKYPLDASYDFEYYTEQFDYKDNKTYLYLAIPLLAG